MEEDPEVTENEGKDKEGTGDLSGEQPGDLNPDETDGDPLPIDKVETDKGQPPGTETSNNDIPSGDSSEALPEQQQQQSPLPEQAPGDNTGMYGY